MKRLSYLIFMFLLGCGSHKTSTPAQPVTQATDLELPKVSFTYAPASVKCDNLLKFLQSYSLSAKATIVADDSCESTETRMARSFLVPNGAGVSRTVLKIMWPRSIDVSEFKVSAVVTGGGEGIFQREQVQAVFSEWVKTNFRSPAQVCDTLRSNGLECPSISQGL